MSFLRNNRSNFYEHRDDSFIISDSDEEIRSCSKGIRTFLDEKIIQDTDSEGEASEHSFTKSDSIKTNVESLNSDEEDLQFMNNSHKVSIIESSSDSECDSSDDKNKKINKLKRFSIYENSMNSDSLSNKSTPIISHIRKRARKKVICIDSDSDDVSVDYKTENVKRSPLSIVINDNKSNIVEKDIQTNFHKLKNESINNNEKISNFSLSNKDGLSKFEKLSATFNNANKEFIKLKQEKPHYKELSIKCDDDNEKLTEIKRDMSFDDILDDEISMCEDKRDEAIIDIHEPSDRSYNKSTMKNYIKKENSFGIQSFLRKDKIFPKEENITDEIVIHSSTSTSENELDKEVITLARKEVGASKIDPIEAQKKEHLQLSIDFIQKQIDKLNKFAQSVDINLLPDKGAKVHETIKQHEQKLSRLRMKLTVYDRKSITTCNSIQVPKNTEEENLNVVLEKLKNNKLLDNNTNNKTKTNIKNDAENKITNRDSNEFDIHKIPNLPKHSFNTIGLGTQALETLTKEQTLTQQKLVQLHESLTLRPTLDKKENDPYGLKVPLMPHQQQALTWIKWREKQKPRGGILADDMGLGKTLTMIALVLATVNDEKESASDESSSDDGWLSRNKHKRYYGGTLVVCPASLINQWEAEIKNRCKRGLLSTLVFHGNNRNIDSRKLSQYNVVITTYQVVVREADAESVMYRMEWRRIIVDEAHYIRNHKSKACAAVCGLSARYRWALTGTPIQNKEMDLYAILKFLKCSPFDNLQVWKRWVDNKNDAGKQRLITIMKTLLLRRTKQELQSNGSIDSLPDKNLEIIEIDMDHDENLVYQKILLFSQNLFAQFLSQRAEKQHMREMHAGKFDAPLISSNDLKTQFTKAQQVLLEHHKNIEAHEILVLLLRLRQMCCHPALIYAMLDKHDAEMNGLDDEEEKNTDLINKLHNMSVNEDENIEEYVANYKIDNKVATNLLTKKNPVFNDDRRSSKVRAVIETIEEIVQKGDKLIVVSQWTSFLNVVAKNLKKVEDAKYAMFTGNVAVKDRQAIIDKINDPHDDVNILLLSLTSGGVGLNLIGANHLLLIDIHWNPQLEAQAQDRIYRFGQHKSVYIYKFICKDSIEERIKKLQDKKLEIANHVLSGTKSVSSKLTIEDLKLLFS